MATITVYQDPELVEAKNPDEMNSEEWFRTHGNPGVDAPPRRRRHRRNQATRVRGNPDALRRLDPNRSVKQQQHAGRRLRRGRRQHQLFESYVRRLNFTDTN